MTSIRAPVSFGLIDLIAASTRFNSDSSKDRASISNTAKSGTVFALFPEFISVGTTVVPCFGSSSDESPKTMCAISVVALIPFSGSSPAWDASP